MKVDCQIVAELQQKLHTPPRVTVLLKLSNLLHDVAELSPG